MFPSWMLSSFFLQYIFISQEREHANICKFSFIKCSWEICRLEPKTQADCEASLEALNLS